MKRQTNSLRTWTNPLNLSLKEDEGEGIREGESLDKSESIRECEAIRKGEGKGEDEYEKNLLLPSSFFLLPSSLFLLNLGEKFREGCEEELIFRGSADRDTEKTIAQFRKTETITNQNLIIFQKPLL